MSEWTDERCDQLRELVTDSLTAAQIGKIMGISRSGVIGKVFRMGLSLKWTRAPAKRKRRRAVRTIAAKPPALAPCEPIDLPPDQSSFAVSLLKIGADQCRYTVSPDRAPHLFCGAPGYPWCIRHHAICHTFRPRGAYREAAE